MTSLAIVSSYYESCGIAAFTKVLCDSIAQYSSVQVEVIQLDLKLLQSIDRATRHKANLHIKDICRKLASFNGVNIQLESGLYGTFPLDIIRRVKWLLAANPNTSVTLHSPRLVSSAANVRTCIKKLLNLEIMGGIKGIFDYIAAAPMRVNKKLIHYAILYNSQLIVHTLRSRDQIQKFFNHYERIVVHPLKMVSEKFVSDSITLNRIRQQLGLLNSDIIIGMFGYISPYKGYVDALYAMRYLPKEYKLLIFGRQHPQTIQSDQKKDSYLQLLIDTFDANREWLEDRVFFIGELDDEAFLQVASSVDVTWLPYYENGQDGSGIAAICLDVCKRVLCSTSFVFDELFKLISYPNVMRFDIGNILELATKTKMMMACENELMFDKQSCYNLKSQVATYLLNLPENIQAK